MVFSIHVKTMRLCEPSILWILAIFAEKILAWFSTVLKYWISCLHDPWWLLHPGLLTGHEGIMANFAPKQYGFCQVSVMSNDFATLFLCNCNTLISVSVFTLGSNTYFCLFHHNKAFSLPYHIFFFEYCFMSPSSLRGCPYSGQVDISLNTPTALKVLRCS